MMAAEFLRVTQCNELDAAMDDALSSLQPSQRCEQPGCSRLTQTSPVPCEEHSLLIMSPHSAAALGDVS